MPANASQTGAEQTTQRAVRTSAPNTEQQTASRSASATSQDEARSPATSDERDLTHPPVRTEAQKVDAVAALMEGKPLADVRTPTRDTVEQGDDGDAQEAAGDDDAADDAPKPRARKPKSLKDAADALGVDPSVLYDMDIITGDGETVKLGALKDAWGERATAARESVQRERTLDERETALMETQRLMSLVTDDLKAHIKPETVQQLRRQAQAYEARERTALFNAMPELADTSTFNAWRMDVVKMLDHYGFKPQEMGITDHRILLVLRDFMRAKARLDKLMSFDPQRDPPRGAKPNGRVPAQSRSKQLVATARSTRQQPDQVAAVASLIGG